MNSTTLSAILTASDRFLVNVSASLFRLSAILTASDRFLVNDIASLFTLSDIVTESETVIATVLIDTRLSMRRRL